MHVRSCQVFGRRKSWMFTTWNLRAHAATCQLHLLGVGAHGQTAAAVGDTNGGEIGADVAIYYE